jgi:hypothetical protein
MFNLSKFGGDQMSSRLPETGIGASNSTDDVGESGDEPKSGAGYLGTVGWCLVGAVLGGIIISAII